MRMYIHNQKKSNLMPLKLNDLKKRTIFIHITTDEHILVFNTLCFHSHTEIGFSSLLSLSLSLSLRISRVNILFDTINY